MGGWEGPEARAQREWNDKDSPPGDSCLLGFPRAEVLAQYHHGIIFRDSS